MSMSATCDVSSVNRTSPMSSRRFEASGTSSRSRDGQEPCPLKQRGWACVLFFPRKGKQCEKSPRGCCLSFLPPHSMGWASRKDFGEKTFPSYLAVGHPNTIDALVHDRFYSTDPPLRHRFLHESAHVAHNEL